MQAASGPAVQTVGAVMGELRRNETNKTHRKKDRLISEYRLLACSPF